MSVHQVQETVADLLPKHPLFGLWCSPVQLLPCPKEVVADPTWVHP